MRRRASFFASPQSYKDSVPEAEVWKARENYLQKFLGKQVPRDKCQLAEIMIQVVNNLDNNVRSTCAINLILLTRFLIIVI